MSTELDKQIKNSKIHFDSIIEDASTLFFFIGWDPCLAQQVIGALLSEFNVHSQPLFSIFINIIQNGIYIATTQQQFIEVVISCCKDSYSSMKLMSTTLNKAIKVLQKILAI